MKNIIFKDFYWWFIVEWIDLATIHNINDENKSLKLIWDNLINISNKKYYQDIDRKGFSNEKKEFEIVKDINGKLWIPKSNFHYVWSVYFSLLAEEYGYKLQINWKESNKIENYNYIWDINLMPLKEHQEKLLNDVKNTKQSILTSKYFSENITPKVDLSLDKSRILDLLNKYFPEYNGNVYWAFIIAPPRSWKTVTMLELARRSWLRTLIIVDKTMIFEQFKTNAIPNFFDVDIKKEVKFYKGIKSFRGWEKIKNTKLWVAMINTLYSVVSEKNPEKLAIVKDELSKYDLVVVDEAHSASAQQYIKVFEALHFKKIFWFTATRQRKDGNIWLLDRYMWTIATQIYSKDVGSLVLPIEVFPYVYQTNEVYWFLKKKRGRETLDFVEWVRNLFNDSKRNNKIKDLILQAVEKDRLVIWIWHFVSHLYEIARLVNNTYDSMWEPIAYVIDWKTSVKKRQEILEKFQQAWIDRANGKDFRPKVLLATFSLLGKWFDWPYFDTLVLMRPLSASKDADYDSRANITQAINRIWNNIKSKKKPLCIDVIDIEPEWVLQKMAYGRYFNIYKDKFWDLKHNFILNKKWKDFIW